MEIIWKIVNHESIEIEELYSILLLRSRIFVVEQKCPYQDIDGLDLKKDTIHVVGYKDNKVVAYARLLNVSEESEKIVVGRVIVDPSMRGIKLGYKLMDKVMNEIQKLYSNKPIFLSAQAHLQSFYGSFGFVAISEVFLEDNIPHINMLK